MNEDIAQLYNEVRKLDLVIKSKNQTLEDLIKEKSHVSANKSSIQKPRRYGVEIEFTPGELTPKTTQFTVNKQSIFRPMYIDWALRVNYFTEAGDAPSSLVSVTVAVGDPGEPGVQRNGLFSFLLGIRDSGSNREWSNSPIPDAFLLGGILSPFYFGIGERGVIGADTQVFFDVFPQLSVGQTKASGTVNSYVVHIGMTGHEEYL